MKKTRHPNRLVFQAKPGQENTVLNWRNQSDQEFGLFAESFHRAAKTLVKNLDLDRGGLTDIDACPVVSLSPRA